MAKIVTNVFERLTESQDRAKLRLYFAIGSVSTLAFYYLMTLVYPSHEDFFFARLMIFVFSAIGFALTFRADIPTRFLKWHLNAMMIFFLSLYCSFLLSNDWSVFHRWSYFVVLSIILTATLSEKSLYLVIAVGLLQPLLISFNSPLTTIELAHFHATNFVTNLVIGLSVRSNFIYKKNVIELTHSAVEQSKMSALGELSAGVAHEVNNPLTILLSNHFKATKLLRSPELDLNAIKEALEKIGHSSYRIQNIVKGLVAFSDARDIEGKELIPLDSLVQESLNLYAEKFRSLGVVIEINSLEPDLIVLGRKYDLMQIMLNLLNNSFDATAGISGDRKVSILLRKDSVKRRALIQIQDSGPGISESIQDKIMEPFFTTKEVGKGTGLGLSSALGLAKANDGELYFCPEISRSCFILNLPLPS